jgi:methylthioribose-1-phosphate isomerase
MSLPRRGLLAIWLAMQLLLVQQFALAHHVHHLAENLAAHATAAASTVQDGEENESAAHVLAHVCTTCLACLGFGTALASGPFAMHAMGTGPALTAVAVLPAPTFHRPLAFQSRAPPKLQD